MHSEQFLAALCSQSAVRGNNTMSKSHNIMVSLNTIWTWAVTIIKRVSFNFVSIISSLNVTITIYHRGSRSKNCSNNKAFLKSYDRKKEVRRIFSRDIFVSPKSPLQIKVKLWRGNIFRYIVSLIDCDVPLPSPRNTLKLAPAKHLRNFRSLRQTGTKWKQMIPRNSKKHWHGNTANELLANPLLMSSQCHYFLSYL